MTILAKQGILKPKFLFEFGQHGGNNGEFSGPKDVAVDLVNRVYVLDKARVQVFTSNGLYVAQFTSSNFVAPYALAVGRLGNIYVTDIEANCVHVFNKDFQYLHNFGSTGNGDGELYCPRQIAIGEFENVYVVDWHNERVAKFNSAGDFLTNFVFPGSDIFGLTIDPSGGWAISGAKGKKNWIQRYNFEGNFLSEILTKSESSGMQNIWTEKSAMYDLAVYQGGFFIGTVEKFNTVHLYTPTHYLTQFGVLGSQPAQFNKPAGLAVNTQRDKLYISDYNNHRIQVFAFELLTNFNSANPVAPGGIYHSGDFTGDGFGDILVYRKGKKSHWFFGQEDEGSIAGAAVLDVADDHLKERIDIELPEDWLLSGSFKVGKTLVGNSLGIFSSLIFCKGKQFKLARYWVDPLLIQNELQEQKELPVPFKIGHIRASGDVNGDGHLDIIITKKQSVKALLGPEFTELKEITGLPAKLPGRVRAMYHEGDQDNVLVFQRGKKPGRGYFINSNFVATLGPTIAVNHRIRAMSGSTPVTQKKRTIKMGGFTHEDPKVKGQRKLKVVGPR